MSSVDAAATKQAARVDAPPRATRWANAYARVSVVDLVAATLVVAVVGAVTGAMMGDFPTGNDPANWLARGNAMWTGEAGLTDYARPLVPTLVRLLAAPLGATDALRAVGVVSSALVALAVFAVARAGSPVWVAVPAALFVGVSRPVVETVAFGGYPQNFGLAGCVLATWLMARQLEKPQRPTVVALAASLALAALSHHVYFLLTLACCGLLLAQAVVAPGQRERVRTAATGLAVAFGVALLAFVPTLAGFAQRGYEPSVGPDAFGFHAALGYMFGDAPKAYAVLFGTAAAYAALACWRRPAPAALQAGGAMLAVAAVTFVASQQPRLLALAVAGASICCAILVSELLGRARTTPGRALVALAPALAVFAFAAATLAANRDAFAYYRVLDEDLTDVIHFMDSEPRDAAVAVVAGRDGWPLGWWFAALGEHQAAVGADSAWLAFPREREKAAAVNSIARARTSSEAAALAAEAAVTLVVGDQGVWERWHDWLSEATPAVELAYSNERYVVLRFHQPEMAR